MSDLTIAEQPADLPPAILTVYTQLVTFTEPATVDDIAQSAETARSSTFRALVTLELRGLAHHDRGIKNGPKRCPDLWRANHTKAALTSQTRQAGLGNSTDSRSCPSPRVAPSGMAGHSTGAGEGAGFPTGGEVRLGEAGMRTPSGSAVRSS
ncbi:helix-turn-helix domain-containing protein [Streptomyces phaeochromogenes]